MNRRRENQEPGAEESWMAPLWRGLKRIKSSVAGVASRSAVTMAFSKVPERIFVGGIGYCVRLERAVIRVRSLCLL